MFCVGFIGCIQFPSSVHFGHNIFLVLSCSSLGIFSTFCVECEFSLTYNYAVIIKLFVEHLIILNI